MRDLLQRGTGIHIITLPHLESIPNEVGSTLVAPHGDARKPQVVIECLFKCTARTHCNLFILHLLHHGRPLSYLTPGRSIYDPRLVFSTKATSKTPTLHIRRSGPSRSRMTFSYQDGIALLQLIAFVPCLFLAILLCYQQGMKAVASCWRFLIILSCLRIAGAICQLITITNDSIDVVTTKITCDLLGIAPLTLAALGLLQRV